MRPRATAGSRSDMRTIDLTSLNWSMSVFVMASNPGGSIGRALAHLQPTALRMADDNFPGLSASR